MRWLAIGCVAITLIGCQAVQANVEAEKNLAHMKATAYPRCQPGEWGYPFPSAADDDSDGVYIYLSQHPVQAGERVVIPGDDIICVYDLTEPVMVMNRTKAL